MYGVNDRHMGCGGGDGSRAIGGLRRLGLKRTLMPEARADGYWMDNIATWPNTNYPLSAGAQAIVTFCNYAAPISVLLGSWASSYFLLKEKQL